MKNKQDNFIEVMKLNNEEKIREYLLHNGKKPKPISPFIFTKADKENSTSNDLTLKEG